MQLYLEVYSLAVKHKNFLEWELQQIKEHVYDFLITRTTKKTIYIFFNINNNRTSDSKVFNF